MEGFLKFAENELSQAESLIKKIDSCLGLPNGNTITWDEVCDVCSLDLQSSAYTEFWAYVVKVDTNEMGQCLTEQELNSIIQLPDGIRRCE